MPIVTPDLPANGDAALVDKYNAAINAIAALVNGGLDSDNFVDNAVISSKILDAAVTAAKLATDAVETAKIKDKNVTTRKISPSRFSVTGGTGTVTRQTIASATTGDLTGITYTYTAGVTDETVYLFGSAMYETTSSGIGTLQIYQGSTLLESTYRAQTGWRKDNVMVAFDATASTSYTFKLSIKNESGATINVANATTDAANLWYPRLYGFAVAR